jgi:ATP-dependent helicase HrpA
VFELEPPVRAATAFAACLERGRAELVAAADELRALLHTILPAYRRLKRALDAAAGHEAQATARDELAAQLSELVGPRMLTTTPREWRKHVSRYLAAAELRWQKRGHRTEAEHAAQVREAVDRLAHWRATRPDGEPWPKAIVDYRWLIEELRVSLFAQQLGTVRPVSAKRVEQAWRKAFETP